mmetsp:Transcript_15749/g.52709  ORF Transcript_15749/g.52709 Transcript_15749/m.52709 type:complete len:233 (+) Transcript_15749:468-1166(+)
MSLYCKPRGTVCPSSRPSLPPPSLLIVKSQSSPTLFTHNSPPRLPASRTLPAPEDQQRLLAPSQQVGVALHPQDLLGDGYHRQELLLDVLRQQPEPLLSLQRLLHPFHRLAREEVRLHVVYQHVVASPCDGMLRDSHQSTAVMLHGIFKLSPADRNDAAVKGDHPASGVKLLLLQQLCYEARGSLVFSKVPHPHEAFKGLAGMQGQGQSSEHGIAEIAELRGHDRELPAPQP